MKNIESTPAKDHILRLVSPIASRARATKPARDELAAQVRKWLNAGNEITVVPASEVAPPRYRVATPVDSMGR